MNKVRTQNEPYKRVYTYIPEAEVIFNDLTR
jgi:hypothetical protein